MGPLGRSNFHCLFGLTLLLLVSKVNSYNILLLPGNIPSHRLYISGIAEALVEAKHKVSYVLPSSKAEPEIMRRLSGNAIDVLRYALDEQCIYQNQTKTNEIGDVLLRKDLQEITDAYVELISFERRAVHAMMDDAEFLKTVVANKYDLVIITWFHLIPSLYILPHKLQIPYITVTTFVQPMVQRIPALPSFVPATRLLNFLSEKMTFMQRLQNTASFAYLSIMAESSTPKQVQETWKKYLPDVPPPSIYTLLNNAELTLENTDVLLGYPSPSMPNAIAVGGLTLQHKQTLPAEFRAILDAAVDGVMLVSFGSYLDTWKDHRIKRIFEVLAKVGHPVLFRFTGTYKPVPPNVHIFKWLPQNDLLGHPKVKLFITHCGNNGQMEALFHAVPMVGLPVLADQWYNAMRIEYKGYGRKCDIHEDPVEKTVEAILDVWTNDTYRQNIKRASSIYRNRPETPRQRAVFWIEHVLKFGSNHLRSYANDMPLYQYWMLDVLLFTVGCLFTSISIMVLLLYTSGKYLKLIS